LDTGTRMQFRPVGAPCRAGHDGGQIAYFVMAVTVTVNHPAEQPYLKG
jgi:hypothetical protein